MDRFNINLDYLKSISGGDEDFVLEMIQCFVELAPEVMENLKKHAEVENWQLIGEEAHKFGPNMAFLGLDDLQQLLENIEEEGLRGNNPQLIPPMVSDLNNQCNRLVQQLTKEFKLE
jgi:HPt (histidine-containing phosphotransfer) domain-containing protein